MKVAGWLAAGIAGLICSCSPSSHDVGQDPVPSTGSGSLTAGTTVRVSAGSSAVEPAHAGPSRHPSISADGRYVAFDSIVSTLVDDDANGVLDVFVRDTLAPGATTRVSLDSSGVEGDDHSWGPVLSADARYVAFHSKAANLVGGDANGIYDVFVRDRQTGTTIRASVNSAGEEALADPDPLLGNGPGSFWPSISANGRYVAFLSHAHNLVAGDTNDAADIFVRDTVAGTTERVSVGPGGAQADGRSWDVSISADGRYVVFVSEADNLVAGDLNNGWDVFRRDRITQVTTLVSLGSGGLQSTLGAIDPGTYTVFATVFEHPSISADGRRVVYSSSGSDLVAGDTNNMDDLFLRDLISGTTVRISVDPAGNEVHGPGGPGFGSRAPTITADGRYVAFESDAIDLVAGDYNMLRDAFVRDLSLGTTRMASVTGEGSQTHSYDSATVVVSADGKKAAFATQEPDLVPGDTDAAIDILMRIWTN